MILILTEDFDPHTDHVTQRLAARGIDFVRFNPAAFPARAAVAFTFSQTGLAGACIERDDGPPIDLHALQSVWFRRPLPPEPDATIEDPLTRRYLADENATVLNDLWHALSCPIIPAQ